MAGMVHVTEVSVLQNKQHSQDGQCGGWQSPRAGLSQGKCRAARHERDMRRV